MIFPIDGVGKGNDAKSMMLYVEKMMFTKEFIIAKIAFFKYFKQRKDQSMLQQIPEFLQQIRHGFHVCEILC